MATNRWWKVPAILATLFVILVASTLALYYTQNNGVPMRPPPSPSASSSPNGSPSPSASPTPSPTNTTQAEGALLYAQYCSSCHGTLANSTRHGRTAAQIQAAIASVQQMSGLSNLTSEQIEEIAIALAQP